MENLMNKSFERVISFLPHASSRLRLKGSSLKRSADHHLHPLSITLIVFILFICINSTCSFEVRLLRTRPSGAINIVVNSTLPGNKWHYDIESKSSKLALPFFILNSLNEGIVILHRKSDCARSKSNPLQFSVVASKRSFQMNNVPGQITAVTPYLIFMHGHRCKFYHKKWLRERLKSNADQAVVTIKLHSADNCFISYQPAFSLYDFIPLHFHSCKLKVDSIATNVNVNSSNLDISFTVDTCVNQNFRLNLILSAICPGSDHQNVTYHIIIQEQSSSYDHNTLQRKKRQTRNRPPSFSSAQYSKNIKEEQEPGLSVITITATDPDEGEAGMLTYRMEANQDLKSLDMFSINPTTGLVNTTKRLDRETMASHSFVIIATDKAVPESERRSASTYLLITVDDVNDHVPTFSSSSSRIEISENQAPGLEVFVAKAVDGDSGDNAVIRYSILNPGAPNDAFMIDPQSGSISTRIMLDREKVSSYRLLIQAVDQGDVNDRKSSTFTLSINVADKNDNSPQFLQDSYVINIPEDQPVSQTKEILNVTATDADEGVNAQISYRLSGPSQDKFTIDKYSGKLFLVGSLDYEATSNYQLTVWAEDQGLPSKGTATIVTVRVIDVNDNSPIFYEFSYRKTVDENIPIGSSVLQVQAEDKDSGKNSQISYSFLNPPNPFPFNIDQQTGWIKTTGPLDRETQSSYAFGIKAQDNGDKPLSANTSVVITLRDINDNPPKFQMRSYNASISEEASKGDSVLKLLAIDADEGENARVTYSIDRGNDKDAFQLRVAGGECTITVNKKLDARDQSKYLLTISATDKDGFSDSVPVEIFVLDTNRNAPEFQTNVPYTFEVSEDVPVGTSVFSVLAVDRDRGENARITYSLKASPVFTIDPDTGILRTQQKLDRETVPGYMLSVTAMDNGIPPLKDEQEIVVTVTDVNDNKPEFQKIKYFGKVPEDALTGVKILNVTAVDKDDGVYGKVKYTFDGGDNGNGAFSIDSQGWIRLAKTVDREVTPSYDLVVVAVDSDPVSPQSASVVVHIDVEDVNDNPPIFENSVFTVFIQENSPIGSTVAVITAVDPDEGANALVTYNIEQGDDSNSFQLAGRLGDPAIITTRISLDYEGDRQKYEIKLRAASGTLISSAKVIIQVQDVNDNVPVLDDFSIIYNNFGGNFPNGPIGKIPAYDPDVSDRDRLVYKILSGNKAQLLFLNESTGEVTLDPRLNSNVARTGVFQISVSDGVTEVKATCRLWVRLVTPEMLHNAVTIRLNKMTQTAFLSPLLKFFVDGLANILEIDESNIFVINIEDDTDVSSQILNVSVSIRKESVIVQGQTTDVFYTPEYIREVIYLHRTLLANLSTSQVLPFDDNLCLVEPCTNFEICRSLVMQGVALPFISSRTVLFRPVHPTQIFSCVCPPGFAGMNQTKMCDTEIDLCYSFPCQHNGVCLRHESGYTCQCKPGFTGASCEYNMTALYDSLSCPSSQCKGPSHCIPLSTGGFVCADCPQDGQHDQQCQLRTKSFSKGSYLTFASLKSRNRFTIQLRFATQEKNGLLLYNGRFNGEHDFIALEIINSQIQFSFCLGSNITNTVRTNVKGGVSNGEWTTVKVEYVSRVATISVGEDCDPEIAINFLDRLGPYSCAVRIKQELSDVCDNPIKDCNRLLDLTGPLQVGGMPVMPSSGQVSTQDFIGCISDLYIDHKLVDLASSIADFSTSVGCEPKEPRCDTSPCKYGGKCREGWNTFLCDCPERTGGKDCSQTIDMSRQLKGDVYMTFNFPSVIRYPWFNGVVFRTRSANGVIMQILLNSGDVTIQIVDGIIRYSYLTTVFLLDKVRVDDGQWHYYEVRWFEKGAIDMFLDYEQYKWKFQNVTTSIMGKEVTLIYVGASRDGNKPMANFFTGCVKDLRVGNSAQSSLQNPIEPGVEQGCTGSPVCTSSVCGVGQCVDEWNNHSCLCPAGNTGPQCLEICTNFNPCKNWAECKHPAQGQSTYTCECGVRQSGKYCENQAPATCPAGWWGKPICGPCNCKADKGFEETCNKDNGSCSCKTLHYLPPNSDTCYPCDCYKLGSKDMTCNQATGQCNCYEGIIGRRCDMCDSIFAAVVKTTKKVNDTAYQDVVTCVVFYEECPRNYAGGIWWDQIRFGLEAQQDCPEGATGTSKRKCTEKQSWAQPDLFSCTSNSYLKFNETVKDFESGKISPYIADYTLTLLKNVSYTTSPIYGGDIMMVYRFTNVTLNYEIAQTGLSLISQQYSDFVQKLLVVLSNVTDEKYTQYWQQVGKLTGGATHLMNLFEKFVAKIVELLPQAQSGTFEAVSDDMVLGADWLNLYNFTGATIPKYDNNVKKGSIDKEASVTFPQSLFSLPVASASSMEVSKAYFGYVVYRDLGKHISMNTDNTIRRTGRPMTVNGPIFTLVVADKENITRGYIADPVILTFRLTLPNNRTNMYCARWAPSASDETSGTWTTAGCRIRNTSCRITVTSEHCEEFYVTCECNHLSTYAVIIDVADGTALLPAIIDMEAVTYVLTTLSLMLLLLSFFVLFTFKRLQCNWNSIRINLIFTIFIVDLAYVIGINKTSPELFCRLIAIALHYFYMACFAWLFIEMLHIYRMLTEKQTINYGSMKFYYLLGYVIPGIVVGLAVGLYTDAYGNASFCWLVTSETFIWSFAGPIALVIVINVFTFIFAAKASCAEKIPISDVTVVRYGLLSAIFLLFLLSVTWILGLLSVNFGVLALHYLHAICIVFEGIFIFLVYILLNKKVRLCAKRFYYRLKGKKVEFDENLSGTRSSLPHSRSALAYRHDSTKEGGVRINNIGISTTSTTSHSSKSSHGIKADKYLQSTSSSTSEGPGGKDIPYGFESPFKEKLKSDLDGDKDANDSDSDSDASMDRNSLELASSHSSDEDDEFDLGPRWENQVPKSKAVELAIEQLEKRKKEKERERLGNIDNDDPPIELIERAHSPEIRRMGSQPALVSNPPDVTLSALQQSNRPVLPPLRTDSLPYMSNSPRLPGSTVQVLTHNGSISSDSESSETTA